MRYPAYESRELTGTILLRDPEMMVKWRAASEREDILARTINGVNYSIVRDTALDGEIQTLYAGQLNTFVYDDVDNTVSPVALAQDASGQSDLEKVRYTSGPTGADRDNGGNT